MSLLQIKMQSVSKKTKLYLLPCFQDKKQKKIVFSSQLASQPIASFLKKDPFFQGKWKQTTRMHQEGAVWICVGMGALDKSSTERARHAGAVLWNTLSDNPFAQGFLHTENFQLLSEEKILSSLKAFLEGFLLASYQYWYPLQAKKQIETLPKLKTLTLYLQKASLRNTFSKTLVHLRASIDSMCLTRDWSNTPSNLGTPEFFAKEAKKIAKQHKLRIQILTEKQAQKEKLELFLAVGRGSDRPPRIVVLEYRPKSWNAKSGKTIALVGKGVTFDSGGISLKPSRHMDEMKHDMTGAATLLGALLYAKALQSPHRIVSVFGFTENMPSGKAIQPGNVFRARNGKTVEVANTDAEGRLVLADLLCYAQDKFHPDYIIDAATLTGAASIALGSRICAVMGQPQVFLKGLQDIGKTQDEHFWELPLLENYLEDMKSPYADISNISNVVGPGTIYGGLFLKSFVKKNQKWMHLDIAAIAWGAGFLPYCPSKGGSGLVVRSLGQFLAQKSLS